MAEMDNPALMNALLGRQQYEAGLRKEIGQQGVHKGISGLTALGFGAATPFTLPMWPSMPLAGPAMTALGLYGLSKNVNDYLGHDSRQRGLESELEALATRPR